MEFVQQTHNSCLPNTIFPQKCSYIMAPLKQKVGRFPLPPKWVTSFMDSPKYFKKSSALTFFCCMGVGLGDLDLGLEGECAWRPLPFCMPDGWWGVMLLPEEDGRNLLWSSWDNLLLKRKEKSSYSSTSVFYLIKKVFTTIDY